MDDRSVADHCTAWANLRWARLSEGYRDPGVAVGGDGRETVGNIGGTIHERPRDAAMVSDGPTGAAAPWGHVVIVDAMQHDRDGSMSLVDNDIHDSEGIVRYGTATRPAHGTWSGLVSLDGSSDVTVAELPEHT